MHEIWLTMKRLKWFFYEKRFKYFICLIALVFVSILPVIPAKVLGIAIDDIAMGTVTTNKIFLYFLGTFGVELFVYLVNIYYHYTINSIGQELAFKLREQYLKHLFTMDSKIYEEYTKGDLVARMSNDLNIVTQLATSFLQNLIYNFALIVSSIAMMAIINPILTVCAVTFMPIAIFILNNARKKKENIIRFTMKFMVV